MSAPSDAPALRLRPGEPLAEGIGRVLTEPLDHALACLDTDEDRDAAVHELRKALKRSRAVLRVVRPIVGEEPYRRENAALRDAARPWGAARDGVVLVRTAESLGGASVLDRDRLPEDTRRVLLEARTRVPALTSGPAWAEATHAPGVQRVLDRARRDLRRAERDGTTERLHRWRKDVKYLAHQAELLLCRVDGDVAELADASREGWRLKAGERRRAVREKALAAGRDLLDRAVLLTRAQSRPTRPVS